MNPPDHRLLRLAGAFALLGLLFLAPVFCRGEDNPRVEILRAKLPYVTVPVGISNGGIFGSKPVMVEAKPYKDLRVGDMVVFWPEGRPTPILHCLVGRFGPLWETSGLNMLTNRDNDPFYCTPSNYIGIVKRPR